MVAKAEHVALRNGLAVLTQRMGHVRSVAVNLLIPAGYIYEQKGEEGIGNVLSEMLERGAGKLDGRAFAQGLDRLGIDLNCSLGTHHMRISATGLADKVEEILGFLRDIVLHPKLPAQELSAARKLALQELQGLDDDPRSQALVELRRNHFPFPYSNNRYGTAEGIEGVTHASLKSHWEKHGHAKGSILSIAGLIDPQKVTALAEDFFDDWAPGKEVAVKPGKPGPRVAHIVKETQQTQIALAWDSVPPSHDDFYLAQGAVQVLSGGMSSRLFTEVREKQGLCYAVWASYVPLIDRGAIFCYAGTTHDRAHLTLESVKKEIQKLKENITKEEVDRVKVGLKTSLLMQEDSSAARSGSLANDWFYLGRVRSLEEIEAAVAGLTNKSILEGLRRTPPAELTQVTMGPEPGKGEKPAKAVKTQPAPEKLKKETKAEKTPVEVAAKPAKAAAKVKAVPQAKAKAVPAAKTKTPTSVSPKAASKTKAPPAKKETKTVTPKKAKK